MTDLVTPRRRTLTAVVALLVGVGGAPWTPASAAPSLEEARAGYDAAATALHRARFDIERAEQLEAASTAQVAELDAQVVALSVVQAAAADRYQVARQRTRTMAIAGYVQGGQMWSIYEVMGARDLADLLRRRAGYSLAGIATATNIDRLDAARAEAGELTVAVVVAADAARLQLAEAQRQASAGHTAAVEAEAAREVARVAFEAARVRSPVPGTDLTGLVFDAYHQAAVVGESGDPGCGITWWMLAGVGRLESGHGGKRLRPNGDTSGIVGPQLTGEEGTALVVDSDGGESDGDVEFDRAVGPMQFLPGTWRRWKADGNGDGRTDANNLFDAAAGAARSLCASRKGRSMADDAGSRAALLSYNHSQHYVDGVSAGAHGYRDAPIPAWALPIPAPPPPAAAP